MTGPELRLLEARVGFLEVMLTQILSLAALTSPDPRRAVDEACRAALATFDGMLGVGEAGIGPEELAARRLAADHVRRFLDTLASQVRAAASAGVGRH